ncbi:MAG: nitrate reductase subunit beta [bacterium]|jgi:nitrate reductase beta subunit
MNVKAQFAMVMNLDKCIGCHTCSIPCKHVWTQHKGAEYIWYNNVEAKPGIGYPKEWENQSKWKGGWSLTSGVLTPLAGGRADKLLKIFYNPDLPQIDDYYEPWTYNYRHLLTSPPSRYQPAVRSESVISGEKIPIKWGPNWDDDLGGAQEYAATRDIDFEGLDARLCLEFRNLFMFWLPRICEHCLNPSCAASCPSGALYKRDEDGIVLVDQEKCRGWRFCVSGCPYKKTYFNWHTGRAEKCIFCYPRIEVGLPTLCAEDCVGRIRYIGIILYDADRIRDAAEVADPKGVYPAHLDIMLNPHEPEILKEARRCGIAENVIAAAVRSPIYKLAVEWRLALPLHPEYRTLPMVWYLPPLSPLAWAAEARMRTPPGQGPLGRAADALAGAPVHDFPEVDQLRIPLKYLANLLAAGDEGPVRYALSVMIALRAYMRSRQVDPEPDTRPLRRVNISEQTAAQMYRLLAIAKYDERYVIPTAPNANVRDPYHLRGTAGYPPRSLKKVNQ